MLLSMASDCSITDSLIMWFVLSIFFILTVEDKGPSVFRPVFVLPLLFRHPQRLSVLRCIGSPPRHQRSSQSCVHLMRFAHVHLPCSIVQGLAYMGHLNREFFKAKRGSLFRGATLSMVEFSKQLDKLQMKAKRWFSCLDYFHQEIDHLHLLKRCRSRRLIQASSPSH
jgi:hypothetical protein